MQIDLFIQENVFEYCDEHNLQFTEIFETESYLFIQMNINTIQNLIQVFPLVEMITLNMGNITLFTPLKNIQISKVENVKGWMYKNMNHALSTFFIPDANDCSFILYSDDPLYRLESLESKFSNMMKLR